MNFKNLRMSSSVKIHFAGLFSEGDRNLNFRFKSSPIITKSPLYRFISSKENFNSLGNFCWNSLGRSFVF